MEPGKYPALLRLRNFRCSLTFRSEQFERFGQPAPVPGMFVFWAFEKNVRDFEAGQQFVGRCMLRSKSVRAGKNQAGLVPKFLCRVSQECGDAVLLEVLLGAEDFMDLKPVDFFGSERGVP